MGYKPAVLIVDDEEDFLEMVKDLMTNWGYEADTAQTGLEALQKLSLYRYDVVILDIIMPLINGLETLRRIKRIDRELPVIVLTGDGRLETAVSAMKLGAYDYITKPVDWNKLRITLQNCLEMRNLHKEIARLKTQLKNTAGYDEIIGNSPKMQEVYRHLDRVIHSDVTVLIQGESGTGKELLARAIHYNGPRREYPFVAVNCAAIPETLLESELFGHEKGAFTGAVSRRIGKFEQAHMGTLFLDEIGEMSPATQVKILRVLQEKKFERIGGTRPIEVDVRIISATNKNLEDEVKKGRFRKDLYYRISVYPICIPPLRERREDIPALAVHFLNKFNKKLNKKIRKISHEALKYLMDYDWPGNVRELENVLERSMLNCNGDTLFAEHLPITIITGAEQDSKERSILDFRRALSLTRDIPRWEEVEKEICQLALRLSNKNISHAAQKLGIGRTTFYRKMKKYNIRVR